MKFKPHGGHIASPAIFDFKNLLFQNNSSKNNDFNKIIPRTYLQGV